MTKAINLIQEARFSYLVVSENWQIFDLELFYSFDQLMSTHIISPLVKDVYEPRDMPSLAVGGSYLAAS